MFRRLVAVPACAISLLAHPGQVPGPTAALAEPGISPDGSEIAFVTGGDIWTVPAAGGEARLLVADPANASRPLYSPDGTRLAFMSTRSGSADIHVLTFATGEVRRITFEDGTEQLDGWSPDGRWLYFSGTQRDIAGMNDVSRISADGGVPIPMAADRYASEFWSAPSPDGRRVAITARGTSAGQWWRKGGTSHLDESEIWLVTPGSPPVYEQVTAGGAREGWPMWGADGRTIYYVSNRGGAANVWSRPPDGQAKKLTAFSGGRVLWPSIARPASGEVIAFERDFGLWTLEPRSGKAHQVRVTFRGARSAPRVERLTLTTGLRELALSPDGKKIAFVVRGEIFAASAKDGGTAARVSRSAANESQVAWAPDSRRLVYTSGRSGSLDLYLYDFSDSTERRLTSASTNDVTPEFTPDGKGVVFVRDARELRLLEIASGVDRILATGGLDREPFTSSHAFTFSPDGKWLGYLDSGPRGFTNAWVVPVAGGAARQVSWLPNVFGGSVSWSADGTYLLLDSRQRTENGQLVRVDLIPRTPRFREDQFRDLFTQETQRPTRTPPVAPPSTAPARSPASPDTTAAGPSRIVFDGIRTRLSLISVGVDLSSQVLSPDGKWVVMVAGAEGRQNLYVYPMDELSTDPPVVRQLTSTAGGKGNVTFSPDSKDVYYLESGRIQVVPLAGGQPRPVSVSAEMEVDFHAEKLEVFQQAWAYLRDNFYDPGMHGVNWDGVRQTYAPLIQGAATPDEMRRLLSLMVGELDASHSGISFPGGGGGGPQTGRLGVRFDPAVQAASGQLRISEVLALGPAEIAGIKVGEYLLAVDGARIGPATSLDSLLDRKVNRRTVLTLSSASTGAGHAVVLQPVSTGTEKGLLYRAWVESRRAYVAAKSGGRLGYVHMPDMGAGALAQLYVDLDAENSARDGVVVDIRNNNGGFVNAYALDVFTRRPYLTMTVRGLASAPARTQLGQRALEKPTVLVINQHSLSDAEDFTEGYRAMGLGKIVGEPTAGWIVYTSNVSLIDGTSLRLPFMRVDGADGKNMERAPRPVDVSVTRPVGESYSGRDSQLDKAVEVLLGSIGPKR